MTRNTHHASRITHHASRITHHAAHITILLIVFVSLGLAYSVVTPVFEAPDEPWHFNYVRYVAQGRGLPSLLNNDSGAYQEVGQPPLYYLIAGLVTGVGDNAPVRADDLRALTWHNPGFGYHAPGTVNDNKNLLIHTDREAFPWRGAALAIHLARLVSLAFGTLTVLATWGLAREVFPDSAFVALAAAALVALTPQFVFMSSVVSNDSSAAALSTATLWAIARMWRLGVTLRRAALAGLLVGLASLTKTSTILLGVFGVAAILAQLWRRFTPGVWARVNWREAAVLAGAALVVGGWWYARNGFLYGDALGLRVHLNTPWARPAPVSLAEVIPSLPLIYRSFWGAFGWGNVEMSPVVYDAIGIALVAALTGWIVSCFQVARRLWLKPETAERQYPTSDLRPLASDCRLPTADRRPPQHLHCPGTAPCGQGAFGSAQAQVSAILMCVLWCSAVFASLLSWNQQVEAPHGRLLFPMIGALALLLVAGLARLPRPRAVVSIVVGGFLLLSLAAPLVYIRPAYARPDLVPLDQIVTRDSTFALRPSSFVFRLSPFALRPSSFVPRPLLYGGEARLIGFSLDRSSAAPGEWLTVTLCWTAARPMTRNYTLFVHVLGRENLVVGARTTYPGLGRFPTLLWPADRAFCDPIPVRIEAWAPAPELYAIEAGLYDAKTDDRLEAADESGALVAPPILGRVRIAPAQPLLVSPQRATQADFGRATLIGFDLPDAPQARPGDSVLLRLYWRAPSSLSEDYTVFVHLLDGSDKLAAQADAEPRGGAYPTSAWVAGDVIPDEHTLNLPADLAPGDYVLRVGLYLAPDGPRLPLRSSGGDALTLGAIRVSNDK